MGTNERPPVSVKRCLFKSSSISYAQAFMYIGVAIACVAAVVALVNFEKSKQAVEAAETLEVAEA